MASGCLFSVGDLVEYRSWCDDDNGWESVSGLTGIVIEIIEIGRHTDGFVFADDDFIYDVTVYWFAEAEMETIPDLLLNHYNPNSGVEF